MTQPEAKLEPCPLCDAPAREFASKAGCSARRTADNECGFFHIDHYLPIETWNALPRRDSTLISRARVKAMEKVVEAARVVVDGTEAFFYNNKPLELNPLTKAVQTLDVLSSLRESKEGE